MSKNTRIEHDTMGDIEVANDKLWGAQTERSLHHFHFPGETMPHDVVMAQVLVKKAAALSNMALGVLDKKKGAAIVKAADEALAGKLDAHFPLVVWQTGSGTHRSFYDGGQYAYLDTAPDNSFIRMESSVRYYCNCVQIIDVSNPASPKFVANWWVPGQREGEEEAYKKWPEYGDKESWTTLHGPMYMPVKHEDGGRIGYSAWGAFGMLVHDLTDIRNPKLIGQFKPKMEKGSLPFHTIDIARLNRGFVITNPEVLNPDCNEPLQPLWVVDVKDPTRPKALAKLPTPVPPADAPYRAAAYPPGPPPSTTRSKASVTVHRAEVSENAGVSRYRGGPHDRQDPDPHGLRGARRPARGG